MIELAAAAVAQGAFALAGVSFAVPAGAYAALGGPTGGGKTTLLELIAGLRRPTAGRVLLRGADVTGLSPAARGVGYVPQDAAVFTSMTVADNLGFALRARRVPRREADRRVTELADRLALTHLLGRPAVGLSGGEAQRVALGRALAFRPDVLLLDEPLSAVDDATRGRVLGVLADLRGAATVLHVTHRPGEVEGLADLRLTLADGRVV